jgi:hypothetical protein
VPTTFDPYYLRMNADMGLYGRRLAILHRDATFTAASTMVQSTGRRA